MFWHMLSFYTKVMRILGIDPGTGILGFGIIETSGRGGRPALVDAGVIRTPVKEDDAVRLLTIYEELTDIMTDNPVEAVSVEKLFFSRNVTTAMTVAQARGVILLCAQQQAIPIFEYTPMQIKQAITGYGKADKKQMQEMVRVLLRLKEIPRPDDAADALAAAITHSMTMRFA
jgi:crossover junction endodeoxyribonuclease RuvC